MTNPYCENCTRECMSIDDGFVTTCSIVLKEVAKGNKISLKYVRNENFTVDKKLDIRGR